MIPLYRFKLASILQNAVMDKLRIDVLVSETPISIGTLYEESDRSWFEVVTPDGTYQVIVQDAKVASI